VLVLDRDEVRGLLDASDLTDPLRAAFRSISDGSASVPPRAAAHTSFGMLGGMPGYVPGFGLGAKLVTYFRHNHERGVPGHQALIALFDPEDGQLLALMDGTHITAVRTATAAAVAAQILARPDVTTIAVLGTGVQGREHVAAFGRAFPAATVRLAGRSPARAQAIVAQFPQTEVAGRFEEAARGCELVCLCTDAPDPVIARSWLADGCHVSSVGSGVEVDTETVAAASVFVESRASATQPFPAGSRELAGRDPESVTEVGEVLSGTRPGRRTLTELTLYKSMGHASEDIVTAAVIYQAALHAGVGSNLSL
jgi:alanine dehydrogenase